LHREEKTNETQRHREHREEKKSETQRGTESTEKRRQTKHREEKRLLYLIRRSMESVLC
jgi:hypothetical protein